jgi:serine/threonine protein phosphatase PrpC
VRCAAALRSLRRCAAAACRRLRSLPGLRRHFFSAPNPLSKPPSNLSLQTALYPFPHETGPPVALTNDHKPDRPDERDRITRAHGRVAPIFLSDGTPAGPHRVWLRGAQYPGLAMSRAFGDLCVREIGVHAVPEHSFHMLQGDESHLILATDGVWDTVSGDEAADIVRASGRDVSAAATALVATARGRWAAEGEYVDDVTAVVVSLLKP